ncbi:ectonucleoside triphosphate diphosphohydrolase 1 [Galendromus occidentalis]|uniref:Ectonucleoside triphosphate diphosphohydrolase 1 n=1 Tax=Galendromus occidentalis TaxID=34638 RepID=A0AAJ6QVY2_9ACAR|nr:ectonucleoside triphosphate diphosphohydrolase 1 [Galendromus occidentalis]
MGPANTRSVLARSMLASSQQRVENRLGDRGSSVFSIGEHATIDILLGSCAERFHLPVNGAIGLYSYDGTLLKGSSRVRSLVKPNETIYLQRKEDCDDFLFGCDWLRWGLLCFMIAIAGIITTSCLFAPLKHTHPFEMGVVIDAGSSHSEAVIFRWHHPKINGTGKALEEGRVKSHKGGISSLTPEEVYAEYRDMLNRTKMLIANYTDERAVLYMSATGGMRLLRMQNPDRASAIMESVREAMKESGFIFEMAEISAGADEGAQAWVSINHIEDRLSSYQPTFGSLDLGGASTQITVEVDRKEEATRSLKLYGKEHFVFSKSYLCFGLDQAYLRYVITLLIENSAFDNHNYTVESPCHCDGFTAQKNLSQILGPCVHSDRLPPHIEDEEDKIIVINGKWNATRCRVVTDDIFDAGTCGRHEYKYCFDEVNITLPMKMDYIAFSGFSSQRMKLGSEVVTD